MTTRSASELRLAALSCVSARHRRWRRLRRGLTLQPDVRGSSLEPIGSRDFIICGIPRSGTTLLAAALFQPPSVITVSEPWDAFRKRPSDLFASLRTELAAGPLTRGRLDVDRLRAEREVRWFAEGAKSYAVPYTHESLVGVKLPAWWQYLSLLPQSRFLVCVRHPAEVVESFRQQTGTLRRGLEYDLPFNRALNARLREQYRSDEARRWGLYDAAATEIAQHLGRPNVLLVRYEDWFDRPDVLLQSLGQFLGMQLAEPSVDIRRARDRRPRAARDVSAAARALGYA